MLIPITVFAAWLYLMGAAHVYRVLSSRPDKVSEGTRLTAAVLWFVLVPIAQYSAIRDKRLAARGVKVECDCSICSMERSTARGSMGFKPWST